MTSQMRKLKDSEDVAAWSKKEGFTEEFFNDTVKPEIGKGAHQLEFEYIPTVRNANINRDHAIHHALKNILLQEIEDMKQAFETIFDLDAEGKLQYDNPNEDELGAKAVPRLRKDTKLYRFYHAKGGKVFDKNGQLAGNVFQFWNLVADANSDDTLANPNTWLSDKSATGMFSFLYGGSIEADARIDEYIDNYIKVKTDAAVKYYSEFKSNVDLSGTNYDSFDNLAREMVLNYTIQYNNFADLFDGNAKFHKNEVTTVKRNKQTQGSGLTYAAYNIDPTKADDIIAEVPIGDGKQLTIGRTFKYATINNVDRKSDNIAGIKKNLKAANIPQSHIDRILKKFEGDTTADDGQSYITLDEFARRIYLAGEWDSYKDTFERLFAGEIPNGEDMDKFIQVQKNFYYDLSVDSKLELATPTQIKNAEFILIPQLIKGTSLEALYNVMVKNKVGQVNTLEAEKAAANDVLTLFDGNGNIQPASMTAFDMALKTSAKTGNYSSLYRQQDTPQHMDGENKAGIQIVKKMLDNLPGTWGEEKRQRYFSLMGANIQSSFEELADDIGLELVGNQYMVTDADGNYVAEINKDKFYDMIGDELVRTGSNSNIMEYANLNEVGQPNMPSWMPAVRKKMQNVFQATFTNNVTKQKLVGFHAVQVSGVGFHQYENGYSQSDFEAKYGKLARKLEYHKDGEPYMEIMMPMWATKWYGRDVTIEDLESAGLTDMIGYRIPTEGKQSITRMKVVGLLPEAYGSTIVVPDEWVTQTGADFDVDTIYGIYYESYLDKEHKPHKVPYMDTDTDPFERYVGYVNDRVSRKIIKANKPNINKTALSEAKSDYRDAAQEATAELREYYQGEINKAIEQEHEIYTDSAEPVQTAMRETFESYTTVDADGNLVKPKFVEMVKRYVDALKGIANSEDSAVAASARAMLAHYEMIDGIIAQQQALEAKSMTMYFQYYNDFKNEYFQKIRRETIMRSAEAAGLPSFEEFQAMTIERQNSRSARNNAILDNMLEIISSPHAAEELFTGSHFEDILAARAKVYEALGIDKEWIDIKSPIGQAKYRDQTISGLTLKAISVKRDTFCSVSNIAHTALPHSEKGIRVTYKKTDVEDIAVLNKRFPGAVEDNGDTVTIEHRNIGWSEDNLNVLGNVLTAYSSETTAWILDNVKAGGVRNVNLETFDVFKTIVDMGIDYETAIAFMNQPAVTAIVEQSNKTNSIFAKFKANPVAAAEQQLLTEYFGGRVTTNNVVKQLTKLGLMKKNKNGGITRTIPKVDLNKDELLAALKPENAMATEDAVKYQLSILGMYERFKEIADGIAAYGNITNLDKIGAGQSLTQVHNTIERINDLRQGKGRGVALVSMKKLHNTEKGNEVPTELAEAIYPQGDFNDIDPNDSVYPTLAYHYKYSMLASDKIVGGLFTTENDWFRELKKAFPTNDEQSIFNLENFVISMAMARTSFVRTNEIAVNGQVISATNNDDYTNQQRIYGFEQEIVHDFDFTNMSNENISAWLNLSPGNKLMLLKNVVKGDSILDVLVPTLENTRKKAKSLPSPHVIKVYDNSTDEEKLFEMFRDLYYKDNVWYKTLAQDLIRYSVMTEGMQYRFGNVSKIIPAEVLYRSESEGGTDFITETNSYLNAPTFGSPSEIIDKFFRTHSNDKYIPKYENKGSKAFPSGRIRFGVFGTNIAILDKDTAEAVGAVDYKTKAVKPYIWTNVYQEGNKRPTLQLYKTFVKNTVPGNDEGHYPNNRVDKNGMSYEIVLYPVNRLEKNETNDISVNFGNNLYAPADIVRGALELAYSGRGGKGQVISNSINNLYRAIEKVGRNYLALTAETVDTRKDTELKHDIVKEAMHTMASGEIMVNGEFMVYDDGLDKGDRYIVAVSKDGNFEKQMATLKANKPSLNDYSRIIVEDGNTGRKFVEAFEAEGFTKYTVVGGGRTRNIIAQLNQKDIKERSKNRIDKLATNRVHLDSSSGVYDQLVNRIMTTNVDTAILNNVPTFMVVSPIMVATLGLQEGTRSIVAYKGKQLLLTNLGTVNGRTAAVVPNYNANRKYIDKIVRDGTKYYAISDVALIQIDEYENAVSTFQEEEEFESSIGELNKDIDNFISDSIVGINDTVRFENDDLARRTREELANLHLTVNNSETLDDKMRLAALASLRFYNERRSAFLMERVTHFLKTNPADAATGAGVAIDLAVDSPELFAMMVDNVELQNQFVHVMNSVRDYIDDAEYIKTLEPYDIASATTEEEKEFVIRANNYINDIKHQYGSINDLDTKTRRATDMFYNTIIAALSTNERIQQGLQSIIDPYRDESSFMKRFGSAQESSVPLVQVVLNKVIGSIRKAEMEGKREVNEFNAKYKAIKAAHPDVDWSDLIDPATGYFILPYDKELPETLRKQKEALTVLGKRLGTDSTEYRKMRQANEEWQTKHTIRPFVAEYYNALADAYHILDSDEPLRKIIMDIRSKQAKILQHLLDNDYTSLSKEDIKELQKLQDIMRDIKKGEHPYIGEDPETMATVAAYFAKEESINETYKTRELKEGFTELLEHNLSIIKMSESVMSQDQLGESSVYQEALKWVKANTYIRTSEEVAAKLKKAFAILKAVNPNEFDFKKFVADKKDPEGVVNGNLFTVAEVEMAKKRSLTEDKAGKGDYDEHLIRNKPKDGSDKFVYQPTFYSAMRGDARTPEQRDARNQVIKAINAINIKYIQTNGRIQTANMTIEELNELAKLYTQLHDIEYSTLDNKITITKPDGTVIQKSGKQRNKMKAEFIKKHVKFTTDNAEFSYQEHIAKSKGREYYKAWIGANMQENPFEDDAAPIPNNYLYSQMKVNSTFVDAEKTKAKAYIAKTVKFSPTKYYWQRVREEMAKGEEAFEAWREANHVWDTNENNWVPIRIWQKMEIIDKSANTIQPNSKWYDSHVKDEYKDPEFEPGVIKPRSDEDKSAAFKGIMNNPGKKALYDLWKGTTDRVVKDPSAKNLLNKGYVPYATLKSVAKDWRGRLKEVANNMGLYDPTSRDETELEWGREHKRMPMLRRFREEGILPVEPQQEDQTDAEYADYLEQTYEENDEIRDKNDKAHMLHSNTNYEELLSTFIGQAVTYTNEQSNEDIIRMTTAKLQDIKFNSFNSKGEIVHNKRKERVSGKNAYAKTAGSNAAEHFAYIGDRILHGRKQDPSFMAKVARVLKNFASLKFMAFNVSGGAANVALGESNIAMEAAAGTFFSVGDMHASKVEYTKEIVNMLANLNRTTSTSVTDGIIKMFGVVDLDNVTEISVDNNTSKIYRQITKLLYSQQAGGEHEMQNTALLAILRSHKLVDVDGKTYVMSFDMYKRQVRERALRKVMRDYDKSAGTNTEEAYSKFINDLRKPKNADILLKYNDFKRDLIADFVMTMPYEAMKLFRDAVKDETAHVKAEFEALDDVRSQFELKDGYAAIKEGSKLTVEHVAQLRNKTVTVNHKIHGIYDSMGAAMIQDTWYGQLLFQFKKHVIPQYAKHFGYNVHGRGTYNEARQEVDKGMYVSFIQFIATPFNKNLYRELGKEDAEYLEAWHNTGTRFIEFVQHAKTYYSVLPEYEKAGIRRTMVEFGVAAVAMLIYMAGKMLEEPDKDTQLSDYLIYLSDKLATEITANTPTGIVANFGTMYSNPVAANSTVIDILDVFKITFDYITTGDKKALYYGSGPYSKELKAAVRIKKQIPVYSQIQKHKRLGYNNDYYKTGQTFAGVLPIGKWIDKAKE
jgi:hypothetical protein